MTWKEVRNQFPNQWLLIEATQAHSEENQRILDKIDVIDEFSNSIDAQHLYRRLHHDSPAREMYVIHTSRDETAIGERRWLGFLARRSILRYSVFPNAEGPTA